MKPFGLPLNPWPLGDPPLDWDEFTWENSDSFDPFAAPQRHPILPAGFDSVAIGRDEYDGSGVNEPLWPATFQGSTMYRPTVVDETDMAVFACPDVTFAPVNEVIVVPAQQETIVIRGRSCSRS
jgi:hypothetical protein